MMERGGRLRVLSDLHLGHAASQVRKVEQLKPLLEGADEILFNGDTCEQTLVEWVDRGRDQFEELKALCGRVGVVPSFLTGNHDPYIIGKSWLDLGEGRVFVTHGDMIYPEVAPWNREYLARKKQVWQVVRDFKEPVDSLEALHRRMCLVEEVLLPDEQPCLGPEGRGFLWTAIWPPIRPFSMLRVWATMFGEAERFVERYRPASKVFLFGHFHRAGLRETGGRVYCNTGAFMRGSVPWMVDLDGEWMEVRTIDRRKDGVFHPGDLRGLFRITG